MQKSHIVAVAPNGAGVTVCNDHVMPRSHVEKGTRRIRVSGKIWDHQEGTVRWKSLSNSGIHVFPPTRGFPEHLPRELELACL